MTDNRRRVIFDITTSFRWSGPPAGIVRVERNFALWALNNLRDVTFVFFDPDQNAFYELRVGLRALLDGGATVEPSVLPAPVWQGGRKTNRLPRWLHPLVLWLKNGRRMLLRWLEMHRLQAKTHTLTCLAGWLQIPLISRKYRKLMIASDGTRLPCLPYRALVSERFRFASDDILVSVGAGWNNTSIEAIRTLKAREGFCFILLCHDLIPLLFPHFYKANDVDAFRAYMHLALPLADVVVVTTQTGEKDCREYCRESGVKVPNMAVAPLGFDLIDLPKLNPSLPNDLKPGKFVMIVSTIEPRKGHRLLYNVWRRLVEDGIVQTHGFKLALVGRKGWMVDNLFSEILSDPTVRGKIEIIHDVDDSQLRALYAGAAFCVYPSKYEGYGLPVCEAFAYGRAVIVSTGGALPELVGELSPCLDPDDEELWYETIKEWIQYPQRRIPYEQAIKYNFKHFTWFEAAANFFSIVWSCAHEQRAARGMRGG
jgi:glycosyltransferase involved in cell wall biosynthesis